MSEIFFREKIVIAKACLRELRKAKQRKVLKSFSLETERIFQ
jgi:hypothetical protein